MTAFTWITAPLLALALAPAVAAPVDMAPRDASGFSDIGHDAFERERNLSTLRQQLESLARRLPSQQTLHVELLDVDLAGEIRYLPQGPVRVLGRDAASPRIHLRFELRQGERIVLAGEERLSDPGYLTRLSNRFEHDSLSVEQRLLAHWFEDRFARQLASLR